MSALRILYISVLIGGLIHAQSPPEAPAPLPGADSGTPTVKKDAVPEIAALRAAYDTAVAAIEVERAKWVAGLENWYLDGLGKLLAERTKAGDLDRALLVRAERERITKHTETTAEQIEAMPAALRTLRGIYDGARKKISDEIAKRNLSIGQKFLADLEALQKRITVSGNLERALIVKTEKERLAAQLAGGGLASISPLPEIPAPGIGQRKPQESTDDGNPVASEGPNLIVNANFEKGTAGWELVAWQKKGVMAIDKNELHDGKPTLRIDSAEADHTFLKQTVTGKPNTRYRLAGYIKTKDVEPQGKGKQQGAVPVRRRNV